MPEINVVVYFTFHRRERNPMQVARSRNQRRLLRSGSLRAFVTKAIVP
jgi:hypothetical protein